MARASDQAKPAVQEASTGTQMRMVSGRGRSSACADRTGLIVMESLVLDLFSYGEGHTARSQIHASPAPNRVGDVDPLEFHGSPGKKDVGEIRQFEDPCLLGRYGDVIVAIPMDAEVFDMVGPQNHLILVCGLMRFRHI